MDQEDSQVTHAAMLTIIIRLTRLGIATRFNTESGIRHRQAFRARPAAALRREQQPVLVFHEVLMEANNSGRLEHDGAASESKWGDAGRTQACDYPIHRPQRRGAFSRSIQDEQLVLEQQ